MNIKRFSIDQKGLPVQKANGEYVAADDHEKLVNELIILAALSAERREFIVNGVEEGFIQLPVIPEDKANAVHARCMMGAASIIDLPDVTRMAQQIERLTAVNAALSNLQPSEAMIAAAVKEAEDADVAGVDEDLAVFMWQAMHSAMRADMDASRAWQNTVKREFSADGIAAFAAELYRVANEHVAAGRRKADVISCRAAAKAAEDFAKRIRSGQVPL